MGSRKRDVTGVQKSFYEDNPFPNYDNADTVATLADKARSGIFGQLLDDQVPLTATVLEAGCGTGQLSNFLASSSRTRTVFGADLSMTSLRLGEAFRAANRVNNLGFCQMNLFRPAFRHGAFDLVISNGVLHQPAIRTAPSALVRPRGFVIIGLYNSYARIPTDVRRRLINLAGDRFALFDRRLRGAGLNEERRRAWFRDQYRNPHETKHTFNEVLGWFKRSGFQFISSIPRIDGKAVTKAER